MGLSRHQAIYGIHSIAAYNPETFEPYGIAKVVGAFSFNQSGENIPLVGGSSLHPWEVENGPIESSGSLTLREFPDWLYEAFMGKAATTGAAEATAGVGTLTNLKGSTVMKADTGIASIAVATAADVKTGIYVFKAASATTVDVYALTDVDFARGTDLSFVNDTLKITSSALTVTTGGATTEIPSTGLEITGGSGTIAMTAGDTAWIDVRSINTGYTTATIGGSASTYVDVGLVCAAQKKGNAEVFLLDIVRAKANGVPFPFAEKGWMESEINFTAFYDSTRDAVFRTIRVNGS